MLKRKIKIGYIGQYNPKDRRSQSGIVFMMCRAFENMGAEIVWIPMTYSLRYKIKKGICLIISKIIRKNITYSLTLSARKELIHTFDKTKLSGVDLYLNINSPVAIVDLELSKPLIYRADATFCSMLDYYVFNVSKKSIKDGNALQQRMLDKSSIVLYPSRWVKESAIRDYNQKAEKLFVIESGANIDRNDIKSVYRPYIEGGKFNLLFIGVDWVRKGGKIAIEACKYLREKGVDASISIVGIKNLDREISELSYVHNYGFLNKNNPDEYSILVELIQSSHAFLLPTVAECAGIVFCESSAYGLPSFTHDTGGVGNYVINGVNGYRLPLGSTGEDFGERIYQCLKSGELEILSKQAIDLYNEKFNWEVWPEKVEDIINNIL